MARTERPSNREHNSTEPTCKADSFHKFSDVDAHLLGKRFPPLAKPLLIQQSLFTETKNLI